MRRSTRRPSPLRRLQRAPLRAGVKAELVYLCEYITGRAGGQHFWRFSYMLEVNYATDATKFRHPIRRRSPGTGGQRRLLRRTAARGQSTGLLPLPRHLPVGMRHRFLPGGRRRRGGRTQTLGLGYLFAPTRQGSQGPNRRCLGRSIPSLPAGHPAHEVAGREGLPFLDRLAAGLPGWLRPPQRKGHRLLRSPGGRTAGRRHRTLCHTLPLGPPAGPAGQVRRMAIPQRPNISPNTRVMPRAGSRIGFRTS